jgi:hypothetical protein
MGEDNHKVDFSKKTLVQKLIWIMSQVERIPKNGENKFHKYKYALESDVKDACRKYMADAGVLMTFAVNGTEQIRDDIVRVFSTIKFYDAETSEYIEFDMAGDGQDKNDKGIYKAITGSTKYALMSTFLIPTGDDPEKDSEKNPEKKKASKTEPHSPKPEVETKPKLATVKQKNAIEAIIGKHFDKNRDGFKRWAESRKSIGKRDGKLSLNVLSFEFASKIIDKPAEAAVAFKGWIEANTDPWETEMKPLVNQLPMEYVLESLRALGYKSLGEITDPAHRDELKGRFNAEYDRASVELAKELEEED